MEPRALSLYVYLAAAFVASLVAANVLAAKILSIGGLVVPAGVLAYSVTFAVTDTIGEIWGERHAHRVVRAGFAVQLLVWVLVLIAIELPPAPFWEGQEAFAQVLGATSRIIVASLAAYAVSQTLDVWVFGRLRRRFGGRLLWLRNNASTAVSQTVDTVVFITVAFAGQLDLLPLIAGQLIVKWLIALVDTPVVYLLVHLVRRRIGTAGPAGAAA